MQPIINNVELILPPRMYLSVIIIINLIWIIAPYLSGGGEYLKLLDAENEISGQIGPISERPNPTWQQTPRITSSDTDCSIIQQQCPAPFPSSLSFLKYSLSNRVSEVSPN
ncbi:hypothetical protein CEXT_314311 [Caerostris extrusa]|uniref:Uncharacterized protein n=1 Tax=Caerostris extrusa TaxID=172846 RepID=A0AAV4XGL2_CAEEX|nr:hypothetical protein CEXT_314311 [Caerostris extrusa]